MLATPVVEVDASTTVTAASYSITPNPIAPSGSLGSSGSVTLTLTAYQSTGSIAPNAIVWVGLGGWSAKGVWTRFPDATFTVNSTLLNTHSYSTPVFEYRVNSAGQLTMTFTTEPHVSGAVIMGEAGIDASPHGGGVYHIPSPYQALYQYVS